MLQAPPVLDRIRIESIVGTRVNDLSLYQTAFTHKSALKQYSVKSSYETLEFLGDAVLSFVITKHLFDTFPEEHEGFLTKARTKIVRGSTLSEISREMNMSDLILMDEKGLRFNWNRNEKILEDVFEALIGAIYLDIGILHVKHFVTRHILSRALSLDDDNYKDIVMRWCQASKYPLPVYTIVQSVPDFMVCLSVCKQNVAFGRGKTKKSAEQMAAHEFIKNSPTLFPNASTNNVHSESDEWSSGSEVS
jgi:ribonuclease-3